MDLFLKVARIVKRRSLAKELCDEGVVRVNGLPAKPSKEVRVGDVIEVDTITRYLKLKVLEVPKEKNVSKKKAKEIVEVIEERKKDVRDILDLI